MKWNCLGAAAMLATFLAAGVAEASPYSSIYVFGDSNSDNGRRLALEGMPGYPYFEGRHSNGPVAVEVMASNLGLNGPATFTDYAVGGALSGIGNVDSTPSVANTGLLSQFGTFQATHSTADSSSLFFIWGGDNDINSCMGASRNQCTTAQINAVIANIDTLISDLAQMGAKHFMVMGLYGGGQDKADFRTALSANLASQDALLDGVDILYFNPRTLLLSMIDAANPYGFIHTSASDPCYTGDFFTNTPGSLCSDPDSYVFWDTRGHLTLHANTILGNAMAASLPGDAASVPEPASALLMLAGLLGIGATRRKLGS